MSLSLSVSVADDAGKLTIRRDKHNQHRLRHDRDNIIMLHTQSSSRRQLYDTNGKSITHSISIAPPEHSKLNLDSELHCFLLCLPSIHTHKCNSLPVKSLNLCISCTTTFSKSTFTAMTVIPIRWPLESSSSPLVTSGIVKIPLNDLLTFSSCWWTFPGPCERPLDDPKGALRVVREWTEEGALYFPRGVG